MLLYFKAQVAHDQLSLSQTSSESDDRSDQITTYRTHEAEIKA